MLALVLSLVALGGTLRAEEPAPPPPPPANAPPDMAKMKELMEKRKNGQELTAEEQKLVDEFKNQRKKNREQGGQPQGGPGGPGGGEMGGPGGPPPPPGLQSARLLLEDVNVTDRAALAAAMVKSQQGDKDAALKLVTGVAANNPDAQAVGVATYLQGLLGLEKGNEEEAFKAWRGIKGRAAVPALQGLLQEKLKNGDTAGAIAEFKNLLAQQPTPLDRCRLLKALVELCDRQGGGPGVPPEAKGELLAVAATLVPREEAMASKEALDKEKSLMPQQQGPRMFMMEGGPGGMGMGPGGPGGPMGEGRQKGPKGDKMRPNDDPQGKQEMGPKEQF
jgi:hypothetical protein